MSKTSYLIKKDQGYGWFVSIEREARLEGISKRTPDKIVAKAGLSGHEESRGKASQSLAWACIEVENRVQEVLHEKVRQSQSQTQETLSFDDFGAVSSQEGA